MFWQICCYDLMLPWIPLMCFIYCNYNISLVVLFSATVIDLWINSNFKKNKNLTLFWRVHFKIVMASIKIRDAIVEWTATILILDYVLVWRVSGECGVCSSSQNKNLQTIRYTILLVKLLENESYRKCHQETNRFPGVQRVKLYFKPKN